MVKSLNKFADQTKRTGFCWWKKLFHSSLNYWIMAISENHTFDWGLVLYCHIIELLEVSLLYLPFEF